MLKSALIPICRLALIGCMTQALSMILHNLRSKVKIDVKVKVCADLDSDGVALALSNNDHSLGKFQF